MIFLNSIGIAKKLPAIIAALCTMVAISVSVISYLDFRATIVVETQAVLHVLTDERQAQLETWSDEIKEDVALYGSNPTVAAAITAFNSTFALLSDNPVADRQQAYVTDNPFPTGQKDQLDRAEENIPYNFQHATYHPFFRDLKDVGGYYDVFLFNTEGDLVYSVFKELDYATNFTTGPYADSGLASVFAAALSASKGEVVASDFAPYAPSAGAPAAFLATPIVDSNGATIGVYAIQVPAARISEIVANPSGLGETGELYAIGSDFRMRSTSRFDGGFDLLEPAEETDHLRQALTTDALFFPETLGISGTPVISKSLPLDVLGQHWWLIGEFAIDEVMAPATAVRNKMILVTLIGGIAAIAMGWLAAQTVTRPLDRLGRAMRAVSKKDFSYEIDDTERRDEIGGLAKRLVAFRDRLQEAEALELERQERQQEQLHMVETLTLALKRLAAGDLTKTIDAAFPQGFEDLRTDYNQSVDNLNSAIGAVLSSGHQIRSGLARMSDASDELSRRTENQAATLEQTAAALDEMTTNVKSAASGAKEVEQSVVSAQSDAAASRPVVDNAVAAMTAIEQSSQEISQIISVIDDIAFQTNLLALNAGVEAARAGDAGRGFAVVASEVRALAKRSSDAAKQIKDLIDGSSTQVQRGVNLVGEAGDAVTKIVEHIDRISGLMAEIVASAEEQSTGLGEINIGVTQLDKVTQENASMVEASVSDSHALNKEASRLGDLMGQFTLKNQGGPALADRPTANANLMTFKPKRATPKAEPAVTPDTRMTPTPVATGTDGDAMWEDF